MLTVSTTEEFSDWWNALEERESEEVATGVSLIESLGPDRSPPHSSDLLLWYQASPGELPCFDDAQIELVQRVRRFVEHLSSARTFARVREVSPERALRFHLELSRVAERASRWRRGFGIRDEAQLDAVQAAYRSALEALDIAEPRYEAEVGRSLRQLTFSECQPSRRILYGVDARSQRALLILGESLDRQAFGPSVRRALAVWQQYLANECDVPSVAAGSSR